LDQKATMALRKGAAPKSKPQPVPKGKGSAVGSKDSSVEPEAKPKKGGQKRPHPDAGEEGGTAPPSEVEGSPKKSAAKAKEDTAPVLSCYKVKVTGAAKRDPKLNTFVTLEHSALRSGCLLRFPLFRGVSHILLSFPPPSPPSPFQPKKGSSIPRDPQKVYQGQHHARQLHWKPVDCEKRRRLWPPN